MEEWWTMPEHPTVPDQMRDRVGYRWKMAVQVRMGEKEILQSMKQAVVMLMLGDQGDEDDDDDDEEEEEIGDDDVSPGSNAEEADDDDDGKNSE